MQTKLMDGQSLIHVEIRMNQNLRSVPFLVGNRVLKRLLISPTVRHAALLAPPTPADYDCKYSKDITTEEYVKM